MKNLRSKRSRSNSEQNPEIWKDFGRKCTMAIHFRGQDLLRCCFLYLRGLKIYAVISFPFFLISRQVLFLVMSYLGSGWRTVWPGHIFLLLFSNCNFFIRLLYNNTRRYVPTLMCESHLCSWDFRVCIWNQCFFPHPPKLSQPSQVKTIGIVITRLIYCSTIITTSVVKRTSNLEHLQLQNVSLSLIMSK